MSEHNSQFDQSSRYAFLRSRLRDRLLVELEGTLDTNSAQEMTMFEELFGELLEEERVKLSRTEKARLFEDLVADIVDSSRHK